MEQKNIDVIKYLITNPPKVIWEEPRHHTSWQRMYSPAACASCAMPTADESSHSAEGMTHLHRSASAT